jgi:transposase-like protein
MEGMVCYSKATMERAMKVQEVILRALAKKITWWQAAEIIGISDRQMRRWRERYEEFGYDGTVSRAVLRSERAPFSREAARGAPAGTQLHLGRASPTDSIYTIIPACWSLFLAI